MKIFLLYYFRVITANSAKSLSDRSLMVASFSQQSLASLAAKFHLSMDQCAGKLVTFLKDIGFDYVFDSNIAHGLSLLEMQNEFITRFFYFFSFLFCYFDPYYIFLIIFYFLSIIIFKKENFFSVGRLISILFIIISSIYLSMLIRYRLLSIVFCCIFTLIINKATSV